MKISIIFVIAGYSLENEKYINHIVLQAECSSKIFKS